MRRPVPVFPVAGTVLFLAATAFLIGWDTGRLSKAQAVPELRLRVIEQAGRIRVDWDPSDPAVRSATSATLVARDGRTSDRYTVNEDAVRGGGLDYLRRSNDVLLKLRMEGTGAEASVRAVIAPPPAPRTVPAAEPAGDTRARQR